MLGKVFLTLSLSASHTFSLYPPIALALHERKVYLLIFFLVTPSYLLAHLSVLARRVKAGCLAMEYITLI